MPAAIKAIVFKTPQLKATRMFFEEMLKFKITESSARHFVIYSKSIRVVFIENLGAFEIEIYLKGNPKNDSKRVTPLNIMGYHDPNGIQVFII